MLQFPASSIGVGPFIKPFCESFYLQWNQCKLYIVGQIIFLSYDVKSEFHMESQVTGDPGKMVAVQRNLSKFGIKELARTGKVRCACF